MKCLPTLAVCLTAIILGACSGDSAFPVATGESSVRAINTIPTAPAFSFLIEERLIGNVEFGTSSVSSRYDDLQYTFNFEVALAGNQTRTRVASQFLDVVVDKDYTFVISGAVAAPTITVWEADVREWVGDETVFEARFAHAAPSLDNIDIYLTEATDPPTLPVAGTEQGTLAFGEFVAATDFAGGDYILTITEEDDEMAILFQSDPFTTLAQSSLIFTVFDATANDLTPASVSVINATASRSSKLFDSRVLPTLRFFHASIDGGDTDIYVEDPLGTPLVINHAFKDVTGDFDVPAGDVPITYTTASNMGSILVDIDVPVAAGTRSHLYFIESVDGEDGIAAATVDRRSVETLVRLSFINTSTNHSAVDIYLVPDLPPDSEDPPPEDPIADILPTFASLPLGESPVRLSLVVTGYEIYVTVAGEKTVLAGPVRLDAVGGEVLDVIIYDTADTAATEVALIPPP